MGGGVCVHEARAAATRGRREDVAIVGLVVKPHAHLPMGRRGSRRCQGLRRVHGLRGGAGVTGLLGSERVETSPSM